MQFNLSFEFIYIDIGTRYHIPNMKTCLVYHWNQNRKKPEHKCSSLQQRYLFIGLFDFKTLLVCVKYSAYLRTAIPAYCFNTVGSIFGVLFCLLIKHLILGCKTLTTYEKVSMSRWMKFEYISLYRQRRNISFLKTAHWYLQNFLDNYLLIRPENIKTWKFLKI